MTASAEGTASELWRWPARITGEWSVEDLETLPGNGLRYEIVDGTLLVTPVQSPLHQRVMVELAVLLRAACPADHRVFVGPLDWQPDSRTSLQPDLLMVHRDRIGEHNITGTPTPVVEVLSRGTRGSTARPSSPAMRRAGSGTAGSSTRASHRCRRSR
jgi:Uma2 family endonuclease